MPAGPKRRTPPQERHAFGLTMLAPSHPAVRRLQHEAVQPLLHGHKVWPSSWVLMDYLHQHGVPPRTRVLELGCGWGLVGIACAKLFQAQVTGLDADAAVFPYLQLHAQRKGSTSPPGTAALRTSRLRTSRRSSSSWGPISAFGRTSWTPYTGWCGTASPRAWRKSSWPIPAGRPLTSSVRGVCSRATPRCSPGR
jgi:hypothetical protein